MADNPVRVVLEFDPGEMARRGRIGGHRTHATHSSDEIARTARAGLLRKFELEVDPHSELTPEERTRRATHAWRAHMAQIALKSARTRAKRAVKLAPPAAVGAS